MAHSNTQFKAEHGIYVGAANSEFVGNVKIGGSANIVGDFTVGGSVVFTANVTGNFIPDVSGRALGDTSHRWELAANSASFANVATFYGNTVPNANNINLGSTSQRWFLYSVGANVVGTSTTTELVVTNTASVSNTLTVANNVTITSRVNLAGNTINTTALTQQVIDTYPSATYRTAKYLIEVTDNALSNYVASELLITHNGTTVSLCEYGLVQTATPVATFDADISGGNVRILSTSTSANTTYKIARTLLI